MEDGREGTEVEGGELVDIRSPSFWIALRKILRLDVLRF